MKKMRFLSFLAILLCAFTFPDKGVKLQYTFKKGDMYEFTQAGTQNLKQTIPGMGEMKTEILGTGTLTLKIADLTATGARIEARYSRMKLEVKGPMGMVMDSEGTADDKQNKIIKAMMDKPFFFEISNKGVVEKMESVENIYAELEKLQMDESTLTATKQMFQQSINNETMKSLMETGLINYPANDVSTGATWKSISGVSLTFPLQTENMWNLKGIDGSTANVDSDGIVTSRDKDKVMDFPNGLKAKTDLSGKQTSKSKVDIRSGWPIETKVTSEIKGKIVLLAGNMLPADMEVPMEIMSESTYTIVKK